MLPNELKIMKNDEYIDEIHYEIGGAPFDIKLVL